MTSRREPFFAWPGWGHLRLAGLQLMLVAAAFAIFFGGTNWLTAERALRVRIHFAAELQIPLVPSFTLVYMSIYLIFIAAPFVLRSTREITALAFAEALTIFIAGVCFLLFPAQLAYLPATDAELGGWGPLFRLADYLNLDHNLVPSLHVALSVVALEAFCPHASAWGKCLLRAFGGLIAAATVLTHQHHLVDVVAGFLLALLVAKIMRPKSAQPDPVQIEIADAERPL